MTGRDIIVLGASSGGIEALQTIVRGLPKDFNASLFVVVHTSPQSPGLLPQILQNAGSLPASNAVDGERILPGHIYVAPPDHHLVLDPGTVRLTKGPRENRFRPAVDPLFRSAAQIYGPRVVGVVLTGNLDDGTAGLWAVKRLGGTAIVQDPEEALYPSMPSSAISHVEIDYCIPVSEIAPLLMQLASASVMEKGAFDVPDELEIEVRVAKADNALRAGVEKLGVPSIFACPECHGVLLQLKEGGRTRYRCHTGHAYSADSLLVEITETVEDTLWNAVRAIEETILLLRHMAEHASQNDGDQAAEPFLKRAEEAQRRAELVRQVVLNHEALSESKAAGAPQSA